MVAEAVDRIRMGALEAPPAGELPPIWKEALWLVDWVSLRLSPVYYGLGVPRGDGSPVVVVPGFLTNDIFLAEMYLWLGRIGYRAYPSGIGLNVECPGRMTARLVSTIERAQRETGRRVRVVGHSLGGLLGHRAAMQRPELVSQLVSLGSPLQAVHAHPAVVLTAVAIRTGLTLVSGDRDHCLTDHCRCGFARDIGRPLPRRVRHAAIYTRGDGVVDWHDSQEREEKLNHEVGGTHVGLVFNPRAYRVLGNLLAQPEAAAA